MSFIDTFHNEQDTSLEPYVFFYKSLAFGIVIEICQLYIP
jgi:hypothetical protein